MNLFTDLLKWLCFVPAVCYGQLSFAQVLGIYEFTGPGACPHANNHVTVQPAHAVFSPFISVNTTCTASNDVFNNKAWNTGPNIDPGEYNELRIVPEDCFRLHLTDLGFDHKLSTGSATWHVRTSLDQFASDLFTGTSTAAQSHATLPLPASFADAELVIIRFYLTGITAGTTTWRQDNVSVSGSVSATEPQDYFEDHDGDGYGAGPAVQLCSNPGGYALADGDCNDSDPGIHPMTTWYADHDGDGYGDPASASTGCIPLQANATLLGGDCDDHNDQVHPGTTWYEDADGDGFGDPATAYTGCVPAHPHPVITGGDCNDNAPSAYPGAPEICDAIDNNCNGIVNEGLPTENYYTDEDGDGFGTGEAIAFCEDPGDGYALAGGDCDDANDAIYPGATDIPGNGTDENCDLTDGYLGITVKEARFTIFPNPGTDKLRIDPGLFSGDVHIRLYHISGALALEHAVYVKESSFCIDTDGLEAGMYIVKLDTEAGNYAFTWIREDR